MTVTTYDPDCAHCMDMVKQVKYSQDACTTLRRDTKNRDAALKGQDATITTLRASLADQMEKKHELEWYPEALTAARELHARALLYLKSYKRHFKKPNDERGELVDLIAELERGEGE